MQEAYQGVQKKTVEIQTKEIISYVKENSTKIKKFENCSTVLARQTKEGEAVTINESKVVAKEGEWVVNSIGNGLKLLKPHEFEHFYECENPLRGSGAIKEFQLRKRNFWGIVYEGGDVEFLNSKKEIQKLISGDVIGSYNPKNFQKSLIVLKKEDFQNNFQMA